MKTRKAESKCNLDGVCELKEGHAGAHAYDIKPTHTPGPWTVDGLEVDSEQYGIAIVPQGIDMDENQMPYEEAEANARLIAAAPDLLEAVKAFQEGLRDGSIKWAKPRQSDSDPYHKANVLACAAIAKAEGRA